jgi:hypothetical protein
MFHSDALLSATLTGLVRFADQPQFDPDTVTPGFVGFIATFGVAAIVILLVIDMVRRIRRVNYRAQVREQLEREAMTADAALLSDDVPVSDDITRGDRS